jgi:hypothetical protein
MGDIAPIADRLKRLVLMLSSSQPGEIAAAANAIARTLKSAGADWHDLAAMITAPIRPRDDEPPWRVMADHCLTREERLSERERKFVRDLVSRWRGELTPKQHDWLSAIHQRLQREAA